MIIKKIHEYANFNILPEIIGLRGIGVYNARKLLDIFKDVEAIFDPDKGIFLINLMSMHLFSK